MKRKQIAKERNQFVALALFRKAGSHRKTNKQMRRSLNREGSGYALEGV
jgi:hypothetical protein